MKKKGVFSPRPIDRVIFAVLAFLHITSGIYLAGPWYLDENETGKTPLASLFNDDRAVIGYGILIAIDGLLLLYATWAKAGRVYSEILKGALLAGFLLRLYAFIGVILTLDSWRPPSYLSHFATVCVLGAMWLWVKVSERPTG